MIVIKQYQYIRHFKYVSVHKPLTATDANSTQTWMTFDYINHIFALPPDYLQKTLSITNTRYPHITITQYSRDIKSTKVDALLKVQDSIRGFFTSQQ